MHNNPRKVYIIDLSFEMEEFQAYHAGYANPNCTPIQTQEYLCSLLEQMIAHFEFQNTAVQSFIEHYTRLIVDTVSTNYRYHPLRYLQMLDAEGYQNYLFCLYGFAERVYRKLEAHHLFNANGDLIAGWQHFAFHTLYLIERPEVPHVIFS